MKKINNHISSIEQILETQEEQINGISLQLQTVMFWKESFQNHEQQQISYPHPHIDTINRREDVFGQNSPKTFQT